MPAISNNLIALLNEMVQDYFTNAAAKLNLTAAEWGASDANKYSYIYADLMRTKGPDMLKLPNLENFLSEWDRPYSYGSWYQTIGLGIVKPMDPASFVNGTIPNNGIINIPDIKVAVHPFEVRSEFILTQPDVQLKGAMSTPSEMAVFLAAMLTSLQSGVNSSLYRIYKEVFYKYYMELSAANKTALTSTELPDIVDKDTAITAIDTLRNYKTTWMFGGDAYNSMGYAHAVAPENQIIYIEHSYANAMIDHLKLDHYMGDVNYSDVAGSMSQFLGVPIKMLDNFGGAAPFDATDAALYPIFTPDGAVTGTYAATAGGTTPVDVATWKFPDDYAVKAVMTENDFGNVFATNDVINTDHYPHSGGYTNTHRYYERTLVANPMSNTIYFM